MRPGTPNFVGCRLLEAREMRRMSRAQLAELIGVTRQAIHNFENEDQTPSPDTLSRLADVLRFPLHRFMLRRPPVDGGNTFWRSINSATKSERQRSEHRLSELASICTMVVESSIELPKVNFPDLDVPDDPQQITDEMVDMAARSVRRFWGLGDGPISNVAWLMENNGAIVVRQFLDAPKLDAFSRWMMMSTSGRPVVVLGTDKASAVRSRFDAAHELGHLILHRRVPRSEAGNASRFELLESQAHAFARSFLLPEESFPCELRAITLESLRSVKIRWQVAIQAMIERLYHLGLLSEERRTRLWRALSARGWRKREPLDDVLPVEQPRLMSRAFDLLLTNGIVSKPSLELITGLYDWELADIVGLPEKFFDRDDAPLRLIPQDRPVERMWQQQSDRNLTLPFMKDGRSA
jgi:Zn-dependent peptidase ImmA (M78 family)/transcriptional regulator with XRE-family HTH domain